MATIDQLRALVNDPAGADQTFDDAHYQIIVDLEPNTYRGAATAARTLAAFFAEQTSVTAGPVRVENQQKSERYLEIAATYDQRAREGGGDGGGVGTGAGAPKLTGTSESEIEKQREDTDRYGSVFFRGFTDNPPEHETLDEDCGACN